MKTVLITGAASGIGRAAALRFAAEGWRCLLVDHHAARLEELRDVLGGRHSTAVVDLTRPDGIESLGRLDEAIDVLVNNAGASDDRAQPLVEQSPFAQLSLLDLNLRAPFAVLRAVRPLLCHRSRVVNVASGAGLRAIPFRGYYSATKAGLIARSRVAAADPDGPMINTLCPGFVRTELVDRLIQSGRLDPRRAVARIPLGRMAKPQEVADAIVFLANVDREALSGETFRVCGGSSVYGGSADFDPAVIAPCPQDSPVSIQYRDPVHFLHRSDAPSTSMFPARGYAAIVDSRLLGLDDFVQEHRRPANGAEPLLFELHQAVSEFALHHAERASLTLLLPSEFSGERSEVRAGLHAAARMLIATLACELAQRALRVNAIEVGPTDSSAGLEQLIHFIAGPRAQFVTGQVLRSGYV